jgi:RNA polymerase sigma-70 factor (ECF subfamily)
LTQAFFARVLEKGYLGTARQERGRFRSFMLASVKHFLSNERDRRNAIKRGGGKPVLPLEFDDGECRWQIEPVDESTPERLYERRWATAVLQVAMRRLEEAQARAGREIVFKQLKGFVFGDDGAVKYEELAAELRITEGAVRVAVHRLRRQFGAMLRETIADTVERDDQVDSELRYLLEIVSGGSSSR